MLQRGQSEDHFSLRLRKPEVDVLDLADRVRPNDTCLSEVVGEDEHRSSELGQSDRWLRG
jgi:hypothetical protein